LKDWKGHAESKRMLMLQRPHMMISWIQYYVSLFLAQDWDTTLSVYDSIHAMMEDHKNNKDKKDMHLKPFELCEIQLMRARALEMKGEPKKAIKFMTRKAIFSLLIN